ncbi:hypothetical protein [Aliiglaciecola sp. M165]|uniref:hypothetical protein n=1 Tax=Aliiglaciecola sp. M165 TaxID=2593649 RepID=UPI00117C44AC|nr:hypothetical protein [Aliiglaciecola sp. M165]TRY29785.1 hypothetical protein FM019_16575 [Aliiglaciecola sp. M165]
MLNTLKEISVNKFENSQLIGLSALALLTTMSFNSHANTNNECEQFENMRPHSIVLTGTKNVSEATDLSIQWSECNKDAISLTVYLGTHKLTPSTEILENKISEDIKSTGLENFMLFIVKHDNEGTGASIQWQGKSLGLFPLSRLKEQLIDAATAANWENQKF